jgi:translation initiation factor 2 alpha subunit (eIF-2alpha)
MAMKKLEEGQLVLCTVTKIVGTIVFVRIEEYNFEGTITFAEIFPGKIRNIRDFVFPGKKIVCKILNIKPEVIELSFRRVKVNERNDFMERHKREKNYFAMLRTVLGQEESEKTVKTIKENENSLFEFVEEAREKPEVLEKYLKKDAAQKIAAILKEKKAKEKIVSKKFSLSSKASDGIVKVKETVKKAAENCPECEISYTAAGKYLIKIKTKDPKKSDQQIRKTIETMEVLARKNNCIFNEDKA